MKRKLDPSDSTECPPTNKPSSSQGLHLIQQYDDDSELSSSDEENELPRRKNYSTVAEVELPGKSSSPEQQKEMTTESVGVGAAFKVQTVSRLEKGKRLEVPSAVFTMFKETEKNDLPNEDEIQSIHEGRIRSFPHVRGNWASYVYIPFAGPNDGVESTSAMSALVENRFRLENLEIRLNPSFHLSLSKTVVFQHPWLEPFLQDLKSHLDHKKRFTVVFEEFDVFLNDEKTRTFIGMKLYSGSELNDLVDLCDSCLKEYNLETYYKDRKFHISLGWVLGDQYDKIRKILPELNEAWQYLTSCNQWISCYTVASVEFKYGNKLSHFNLGDGSSSSS